jgi:hypothetical protein
VTPENPEQQQQQQVEEGEDATPQGGSGTTRPVIFRDGAPGLPGAPGDTAEQCTALGDLYAYDAGTDTCTNLSTGRRLTEEEMEDLFDEEGPPGPSVFFAPRFFHFDGPQVQRLARDFGGTIFYDVSNEEQEGAGFGITGGFRFPIDVSDYLSRVAFGASWANVEGDGSGGSPDGTENFLLLPGLGVGTNPSGFALAFQPGGFPPGANAHTYRYDFDYTEAVFDVIIGGEIERGPVEFYYGFGARTGFIGIDDRYLVDVPTFAVTGDYRTDTDVTSLGGFVELQTSFAPPGARFVDSFFLTTRLGFDVNTADSRIRFAFDSAAVDEFQEINVDGTYVTPRVRIEGGAELAVAEMLGSPPGLSRVSAVFSGGFEYGGGAPEIAIPGGGDRPTINGAPATEIFGEIRFGWDF